MHSQLRDANGGLGSVPSQMDCTQVHVALHDQGTRRSQGSHPRPPIKSLVWPYICYWSWKRRDSTTTPFLDLEWISLVLETRLTVGAGSRRFSKPTGKPWAVTKGSSMPLSDDYAKHFFTAILDEALVN